MILAGMSTRAFGVVSVAVVAVTLVAQWVLGVTLAFASGQSDQPGPSLLFDWRWVSVWLLPVDFLVVGLLVSVLCWLAHR